MSEWFGMGAHGPYVWGSYGFFVAVLLWDLLMPWLRRRRTLRAITLQMRRTAARKNA